MQKSPLAQPTASPSVATHCPYCALQCGMLLSGAGHATAVTGNTAFPVNKGALCVKGWTSAATLAHPERLLTPLVRDERGVLAPAGWEVALDRIADSLQQAQARYGRDAVGVFGGGSLTNEKAYQLGKFARVALGTSNVDYNGRFCMSSAATAAQKAFGLDRGLPFPVADLAEAEVILLVGGNPVETMPPIMAYFEEQRRRGGSLIVVDPRATPVARAATLHLQTAPGTDLALANGLLYVAVEKALLDQAFIAARTTGFEAVRRTVASYWPDRVERITGVPVAGLVQAAYMLGRARTAMILSARGAEQHSKGTETVLAFINLALALGHAGKLHAGYGTITGQGNGQGGREHGQKADQLPGYRRIDDPAHRAHVAAVWGLGDPAELPGPGRSAYEMLDTLGTPGGVRALFVMGSNVVVSAPHAAHIQQRLSALDFLAVSDFFLSDTARLADVVLPAAQWAEEDGTTTNLEGRVLLRRRSAPPPPGVRTDLHILAALAERLGQGHRFGDDPQVVFDELRRASAGGLADYAGITYARIAAEHGVYWPCPEPSHPGTPRLFLERFATPDGRARFHAVRHRPAGEEPDEEYPLYLTTGRVLAHYQTGVQTRRVKTLADLEPDPFVELHPALAARHGLVDGQPVQVTTRRGRVRVRARLTPHIRSDTLFVPFHWGGEGRANLLTSPALDPLSRMPEFKVCAARIEAIDEREQHTDRTDNT